MSKKPQSVEKKIVDDISSGFLLRYFKAGVHKRKAKIINIISIIIINLLMWLQDWIQLRLVPLYVWRICQCSYIFYVEALFRRAPQLTVLLNVCASSSPIKLNQNTDSTYHLSISLKGYDAHGCCSLLFSIFQWKKRDHINVEHWIALYRNKLS